CPPTIVEAGGKRQLIAWHAQAINSLDPETGQVYWSHPLETYAGMAIPTPRKLGDTVFFTAAQNTAGMLKLAPHKPAAQVVWSNNKLQAAMHSVFSTPVYEDGHLYGCTNEGELVCLKADTGERVWGTFAPNNNQKLRSGDLFLVKNGDRFFLFTEKGDL